MVASVRQPRIVLDIQGQPIAWKRAGRRGEIYYDTQSKERAEVRHIINSQYHGEILLGPLLVSCEFYFPIPKSWSEGKKEHAIKGLVQMICTPDIDNLEKWMFDVMRGIIYHDDRQIVRTGCGKNYGQSGFTRIVVTEL